MSPSGDSEESIQHLFFAYNVANKLLAGALSALGNLIGRKKWKDQERKKKVGIGRF